MVALICKMIESVTYNSVSAVPGLLLIIGLFSMYDLRKKYSMFYRTFSFFVVYWIQIMMVFKMSVKVYMGIPSVNERLQYEQAQGDGEKVSESTFLQMFFGELQPWRYDNVDL